MPAFQYLAIDKEGKKVSGVMETDSPRSCRQELKTKGLTALDTNLIESKPINIITSILGPKISGVKLAEITRQLSILLSSGIPIDESLDILIKNESHKNSKLILSNIRSSIMEGNKISDALALHPKSFDPLYCSSIAAGEKSGNLDNVLFKLADNLEHSQSSKSKIQVALTYPVILFAISIFMVYGLMSYVVPDVIKMFSSSGKDLPSITKALISLSNYLENYGYTVPITFLIALISIHHLNSISEYRYKLHRFYCNNLISGATSKILNSTKYADTLSMLLNSGVSLTDSMDVAADTISNEFYRSEVRKAHDQVREGASLSQSLNTTDLFPPIMIYMIASGEKSGELSQMLSKTAQQQKIKLETQISTILSALEPLMLLLMGGIVLLIVIAVLLPILNINQLVI